MEKRDIQYIEKSKLDVDSIIEDCISNLFSKEHFYIVESSIVDESKKELFVECVIQYDDGVWDFRAVTEFIIRKSDGACFFKHGKVTEWRKNK